MSNSLNVVELSGLQLFSAYYGTGQMTSCEANDPQIRHITNEVLLERSGRVFDLENPGAEPVLTLEFGGGETTLRSETVRI